MKNVKKIVAVLCTALCLFAAIGLVGCDSVIGGYAPLTPLTEEETQSVQRAYFQAQAAYYTKDGGFGYDCTIDSVTILGYYGTYNRYMALRVTTDSKDFSYTTSIRDRVIGEVSLGEWDDSNKFVIYHTTEADATKAFTALQTAYENGAITKADLRQIAYYARQGD